MRVIICASSGSSRREIRLMSDGTGVCLVIGAGDGLGASIARAFAREGLRVCVTRRPRHMDAIDSVGGGDSRRGRRGLRLRARRARRGRCHGPDRADRAGDRRHRGSCLQHRRERALSRRRDHGARLFQGLGNGGARRVSDEPRGGAGHDRTRARRDPVHRGDRERPWRRGLFGFRRGEARAEGAGAEPGAGTRPEGDPRGPCRDRRRDRRRLHSRAHAGRGRKARARGDSRSRRDRQELCLALSPEAQRLDVRDGPRPWSETW